MSAVKNSRVRRAVDGSGENKAGTPLAAVVRSKFMLAMPCGLVIDKVLYQSQGEDVNRHSAAPGAGMAKRLAPERRSFQLIATAITTT
jgi:hypothetical protein